MQIDHVASLIREVAATVVMPLWRRLEPHEIIEKSKGDLVTRADHEAEAALIRGLTALAPGVPVVGEEGAASDATMLADLHELPAVWVVDPVDGTQNFVRGQDRFAVMVALLRHGVVNAGWVYLPALGKMVIAEAGSGTWINGEQVMAPAPPLAASSMVGAAHIRRLREPLREQVRDRLKDFAANQPAFCAGFDYVAIIEGHKHFSLYNRTLPWDHAPGAILVREAGGKTARFDGAPFEPASLDSAGKGEGILTAPTPESWDTVRRALFG